MQVHIKARVWLVSLFGENKYRYDEIRTTYRSNGTRSDGESERFVSLDSRSNPSKPTGLIYNLLESPLLHLLLQSESHS